MRIMIGQKSYERLKNFIEEHRINYEKFMQNEDLRLSMYNHYFRSLYNELKEGIKKVK